MERLTATAIRAWNDLNACQLVTAKSTDAANLSAFSEIVNRMRPNNDFAAGACAAVRHLVASGAELPAPYLVMFADGPAIAAALGVGDLINIAWSKANRTYLVTAKVGKRSRRREANRKMNDAQRTHPRATDAPPRATDTRDRRAVRHADQKPDPVAITGSISYARAVEMARADGVLGAPAPVTPAPVATTATPAPVATPLAAGEKMHLFAGEDWAD